MQETNNNLKPETKAPKRKFVWDLFQLIVSILLGLIAFLVTNIWAETLKEKSDTVQIVVAAKDISAPAVLKNKDLVVWDYRKDSVPDSAVRAEDIGSLMDVTLIQPVSKGQMITQNVIIGKVDPELGGFEVPSNAKGFLLSASWSNAPLPRVKKGDTITIAYGKSGADKDLVGIVTQNAPVLGAEIDEDGTVNSIRLAIDKTLAVSLVQLQVNSYELVVTVDGIAPESEIFKTVKSN